MATEELELSCYHAFVNSLSLVETEIIVACTCERNRDIYLVKEINVRKDDSKQEKYFQDLMKAISNSLVNRK